jgi:hypothetical protein
MTFVDKDASCLLEIILISAWQKLQNYTTWFSSC